MRFKNDIAEQWHSQAPPPVLDTLAYLMDKFRRWSLDGKSLTITDYVSPRPGRKSYHPKGQAFDARIKDFEVHADILKWLAFTNDAADLINLHFLKRKGIRAELQIDPHSELWGKQGQHFHIELDDGFPVEEDG